jgi:acyl dehydratase
VHQSIVGDRLPLALDERLSAAVVGGERILAHPALVWDVAIGQSTLVTQRVVANLFYRGLAFRRAPLLGDTLHTTTEVVALRQNARRTDRAATGMAVLRIRTTDQEDRLVLDFWRCAMLPLADPDRDTGHADDFSVIPRELAPDALAAAVGGWRLDRLRSDSPATGASSDPHRRASTELASGLSVAVPGGDVVSGAPELARLTLNVATVHHDATRNGRRLVYGGHTIGIAASQLSRALPDLVTIVGWQACDHTAPVFEGDTLNSEVELERTTPLSGGGRLAHLCSRVTAVREGGGGPEQVLVWRLVGVIA